jgi:hypothetical protein
LALQGSPIWQRKLNHKDRKDLKEGISCGFFFAVFAVFVVRLFCSPRFSGKRPQE